MILALILFALIYILMLALPQQRPFVALGGNLTPHRRFGQHRSHRHPAQKRRDRPHQGLSAHRHPLHAGRRADGLRLPVVGVGVSTRLSQKTT